MRPLFVLIHRYVGLLMVPFLFVTGLTGAIISWDHELDDLLNPQLMEAKGSGPAIASLKLAKEIEARDPRVQVAFIPLSAEPGESLHFGVLPRVDPATGRLFAPGFFCYRFCLHRSFQCSLLNRFFCCLRSLFFLFCCLSLHALDLCFHSCQLLRCQFGNRCFQLFLIVLSGCRFFYRISGCLNC